MIDYEQRQWVRVAEDGSEQQLIERVDAFPLSRFAARVQIMVRVNTPNGPQQAIKSLFLACWPKYAPSS